MREAPALVLIDRLLEAGVALCMSMIPKRCENVREIYGDQLLYGSHPLDVLVGADALAINTEWGEFRNPNFAEMRKRMAAPVIFDGRNLYSPKQMAAAGFTYHSIGRANGRSCVVPRPDAIGHLGRYMRPADQPRAALRVAAELEFFQEHRVLRDLKHQPAKPANRMPPAAD